MVADEAIVEGVLRRAPEVDGEVLPGVSRLEHVGEAAHIGAEPCAGFLAEADVSDARDQQRPTLYLAQAVSQRRVDGFSAGFDCAGAIGVTSARCCCPCRARCGASRGNRRGGTAERGQAAGLP
jgi:hypothetical protein